MFGRGFDSRRLHQKYVNKLAWKLNVSGLFYEADPVLRWMIRNVMIQRDPAGNIKLDKARSQDKIDGVMALNCAVAEWMTRTAEGSNEIPEDYLIRTL